eukprot:4974983-Prymnesium_polylepis.1
MSVSSTSGRSVSSNSASGASKTSISLPALERGDPSIELRRAVFTPKLSALRFRHVAALVIITKQTAPFRNSPGRWPMADDVARGRCRAIRSSA